MSASDPYYLALQARGLELGPAFQGLRDIHTGAGEGCASIELPAAAGSADTYCVHPVFLDLGIQCLGAAIIDDVAGRSGPSYLPLAVERARYNPGTGRIVWVQAAPRPGWSLEHDTIVADVFLRDADERLVASLEGLRLKRADPLARPRGRAAPTKDWVYDIEWQHQPLPSGPTSWLPPMRRRRDARQMPAWQALPRSTA